MAMTTKRMNEIALYAAEYLDPVGEAMVWELFAEVKRLRGEVLFGAAKHDLLDSMWEARVRDLKAKK